LQPLFPQLIPALVRMRGDHPIIAHDALKALVNLAQDENAALLICSPESVGTPRPTQTPPAPSPSSSSSAPASPPAHLTLRGIADSLMDREERLRTLYAMLLNNLSRHASVQARLFSPIVPGRTADMLTAEMAQVLRLLSGFLKPATAPAPPAAAGAVKDRTSVDDEEEEAKKRIDPGPCSQSWVCLPVRVTWFEVPSPSCSDGCGCNGLLSLPPSHLSSFPLSLFPRKWTSGEGEGRRAKDSGIWNTEALILAHICLREARQVHTVARTLNQLCPPRSPPCLPPFPSTDHPPSSSQKTSHHIARVMLLAACDCFSWR